jgi:hypothetical protein
VAASSQLPSVALPGDRVKGAATVDAAAAATVGGIAGTAVESPCANEAEMAGGRPEGRRYARGWELHTACSVFCLLNY